MEPAIVRMNFPKASLPARGFRCSRCGEELVELHEVGAVQDLAQRLGLYGTQDAQDRKLVRTGNSVAVTLDPALLRAALGDVKPGDTVRVGRQGHRIVIEAP